MVDKIVKNIKRVRADAWGAFKESISIPGYKYYVPPPEVKYRYPAPGSCAMDETDHPNLYKNDWRTPFRHSEHNIRKIEQTLRDDDPAQAENYISRFPEFPEGHHRHGQDTDIVMSAKEALPEVGTDEMKDELFKVFDTQQEEMNALRRDFAPGQHDYDDDYNQVNMVWNHRGATGFENNPRMKEMFVDMEYWIEDVIGAKRRLEGEVKAYKGQPKKWQILDDDCFDRDQIEKLQAACDAPLPEQLEAWKEKHEGAIKAPFNNQNIAAWRDEPRATDSADFDPALLGQDREQSKKLFLERYEKPKALEE